MNYVYSLKCKDGYYVGCIDGCIDDVQNRLERHQKGEVFVSRNREGQKEIRVPYLTYVK